MAFTKTPTRVPLSFRRPKSRREQIRRRRARSTRYYSTFFCGRRNDDYAPYAFITKSDPRGSLSRRHPATHALAYSLASASLAACSRASAGVCVPYRRRPPPARSGRRRPRRRTAPARAAPWRAPPEALNARVSPSSSGIAANAHSRHKCAAASQDEWSLRRSATNASPVRCAAATAAGEGDRRSRSRVALAGSDARANRARDARNDASASRNAAAPPSYER